LEERPRRALFPLYEENQLLERGDGAAFAGDGSKKKVRAGEEKGGECAEKLIKGNGGSVKSFSGPKEFVSYLGKGSIGPRKKARGSGRNRGRPCRLLPENVRNYCEGSHPKRGRARAR